MHVAFTREKLLRPLQMLATVADKKHTMVILGCLLCEVTENGMRLTASDLETEIVSNIDVQTVHQAGACAIPARKLLDIVRNLPAEASIELKQEGESRAVLLCNKSRFVLSTLDTESFPVMESDLLDQKVAISQSCLLQLIRKVQFSMAYNDVRYFLNGMLWEIDHDAFRAVSTDGHRMSLAETSIEPASFNKTQLIIPKKSITELQKLVEPGDEYVEITIGAHHFRLTSERVQFTSKLIDGRYPDYTRVLPRSNDKIVTADRGQLKAALTRTAILSNEKYRGVRFNIEPGRLKLSANNPEQEEAEDELPVEYDDLPMEIGFNVSYLLDVINAIETDEVHLYISDPKMSLLIKEESALNAQFVIMPIRL